MERGKLIVFEGTDRTGKTTQAKLLSEYLEGQMFSFPSRSTAIGKLINETLQNTQPIDNRVLQLLFAANRYEKVAKIEKYLDNGTHVVIDQYTAAGVVGSVVSGLNEMWAVSLNHGLPVPDLTILLDADINLTRERAGSTKQFFESEQYEQAMKNMYMHFAKVRKWNIINANQSIHHVYNDVKQLVSSFFSDL